MTANSPTLILASSSRYRRGLLEKLGLNIRAIAPNIDESPLAGEKPQDLALRLAEQKARAVAIEHPGALIIASDQVADLNGQTMGKPGTPEAAIAQLKRCSGNAVLFHTALALYNTATQSLQSTLDQTRVRFRDLDDDAIARYVEREPALDCAGAFKVEGLGITLFEAIESRDPNSLIGLPLIELISMLQRENYPVL